MTNERLRAAVVGAGLTPQALSERVGVDPKTVERWITQARIPHRTHRLAVAALVGQDDGFLWPAAVSDALVVLGAEDERHAVAQVMAVEVPLHRQAVVRPVG